MKFSPEYLEWEKKTLDEGRAEGRAKAKVEVAVNLLKMGMDYEQVAQLTGLPMELVLQLAGE